MNSSFGPFAGAYKRTIIVAVTATVAVETASVEREQNPLLWIAGAFYFAAALFCVLRPMPYNNEFAYLVSAKRAGDGSFLEGDWTFSTGFGEHWTFNHVLGPLMRLLSLEVVGWLGRITMWVVISILIVKVGRALGATVTATLFSGGAWLLLSQSFVSAEWILGTFESKVIAHAFVLGALLALLRGKPWLVLLCSGLAFTFHPAVGALAVVAFGVALLADRELRAETVRRSWIVVLAMVPGLIPSLSTAGGDASSATWELIVTSRFPYHVDPFSWSKLGWLALALTFAVNVVVWRRDGDPTRGARLLAFQIGMAVPFLLGVVLRAAGHWKLLTYTPFRLLPTSVALLFVLNMAVVLPHIVPASMKWARADHRVAALLAASLLLTGAVGLKQIKKTADEFHRAWGDDDLTDLLDRVGDELADGDVVVSPPWRGDAWYRTGQAGVASTKLFPYDELEGWMQRITDQLGGATPRFDPAFDASRYDGLTMGQVDGLRDKYGATAIVTTATYSFPEIDHQGSWHVYRIP
jgi:hypothetical protein